MQIPKLSPNDPSLSSSFSVTRARVREIKYKTGVHSINRGRVTEVGTHLFGLHMAGLDKEFSSPLDLSLKF